MYKRFKELRLEKGLTQKELAKELGISVGIIRSIELGTRGIKTKYVIYFDVLMDYILELTDQR